MQGEAGWVKRHDDIGDSRTKNIGPGGPGVEDTSETAQRMRGLQEDRERQDPGRGSIFGLVGWLGR